MTTATIDTLFHFSFAVNDLDRARRFYGELLGCPEGRKLAGRADFNFFGHHIVAHLSADDVVGDKGSKLKAGGGTPLRHFGVVMPLEKFQETAKRLTDCRRRLHHEARDTAGGHGARADADDVPRRLRQCGRVQRPAQREGCLRGRLNAWIPASRWNDVRGIRRTRLLFRHAQLSSRGAERRVVTICVSGHDAGHA